MFFSSSSSCPGSLQFSRERHGVEVGLCLVDSVVALLFYMVECTCIGNKFLERSRSFFPAENNICFPGQCSQDENIKPANTAKFRF